MSRVARVCHTMIQCTGSKHRLMNDDMNYEKATLHQRVLSKLYLMKNLLHVYAFADFINFG